MIAALHNQTQHPDGDVRPLIELAAACVDLPAPVHVHLYDGHADGGQPCGWAFGWGDELWIKVGLPAADSFPIGPLRRLEHPDFPVLTYSDWKEALAGTAAHELFHLGHIHRDEPYDEHPEELGAEQAAARALERLRR